MRILLTTTSYHDTPGRHHEMLKRSECEIVRERGPLDEAKMLELVQSGGGVDGILHGDDRITRKVIEAALPRLKCLSKYGIGLDSVDVEAATELNVPVLFTPGVNHTTVAEHTFGLMIALAKRFWPHIQAVKGGEWTRRTGHELYGKTLGILGLGRIGKEVAIRSSAFGMHTLAFDPYWDESFAAEWHIERAEAPEDVLKRADIVSLHMSLGKDNHHFINAERIWMMKEGSMILNCARGALVDEQAVATACRSGRLLACGGDVLEH